MHSTDCSLQFYTFLDNKTDKITGTGLTLILQIIALTWPVVKKHQQQLLSRYYVRQRLLCYSKY